MFKPRAVITAKKSNVKSDRNKYEIPVPSSTTGEDPILKIEPITVFVNESICESLSSHILARETKEIIIQPSLNPINSDINQISSSSTQTGSSILKDSLKRKLLVNI